MDKILVKIANNEDPNQTALSEAICSGSATLHCLFSFVVEVTSVRKCTVIVFCGYFSDDFSPSPNLDNLPEGAAPPLADLSISEVNRKLYL